MRQEHLATAEALDAFLRGFEEGTLPKPEWTHGAHVAAGASYLHGSSFEVVLPQMRRRIREYNEAVGGQNTATSGYHETLTRFWLLAIAALLEERRPESRLAAARLAVAVYGAERALHGQYYSWDVVRDSEARLGWKEPDRMRMAVSRHPID